MQLFPAARVLPQGFALVVWPKSPLVVMLLMSRVVVPVLVSVTAFVAPVSFRGTVPHVKDVGVTVTVGPVTMGFTVSLRVVLAVKLPDTPEMVTVTVPVAAVEVADKVSVLVLEVGFGLNAAVTPLGKPEAERVTLPLKPPTSATVIVLVPLLPCVTLTLLGEADSVKPGC